MYVRATQYCARLKQGNSPDQRLDVLITGSPSLAIPNTHAQRPERSRLPRQRSGESGLRWSKLSRLSRPSRLRRLRRLRRLSKPSRPSRPSRPSKRNCRCTCDFGHYRAFTCDFYIPPPFVVSGVLGRIGYQGPLGKILHSALLEPNPAGLETGLFCSLD
jgi:hypothetical protein